MKLLLISPEKNCKQHEEIFKYYMVNFLKNQKIEFEIVIIHQENTNLFNKGSLFNIAFTYSLTNKDFDYIILHDINLLPYYNSNYHYNDNVSNLVSMIDNNSIKDYFEGVIMLPKDIFIKINGFSNMYEGYNIEDNDLIFRLCKNRYTIDKLNYSYTSLSDKYIGIKNKNNFLKKNPDNGLINLKKIKNDVIFDFNDNDFQYKILNTKIEKIDDFNITHLYVDFISRLSNKNIKIALCLFGYPRMYKESYESIKKCLLDKYNVDVYCHLWWEKDSKIPIAQWNLNKQKNIIMKEDIIENIKRLYNPKKLIVENPKNFNHILDEKVVKIYSELYKEVGDINKIRLEYCIKSNPSMFYSMTESTNMVNYNNNYDFVIRTRYDICLNETYLPDIHILDKNIIHIPDQFGNNYNTKCDVFIICDGKIAKEVYNVYPYYNRYFSKKWSAQNIWCKYLKDNNYRICESFKYENTISVIY